MRRSRKSLPETPLSPETVRENYKTAKVLKALGSHNRRTLMRVKSSNDTMAEVLKKEVAEKLTVMTGKLKTAVKLHNAIKSPFNNDDERVEHEGGEGGRKGEGGGEGNGG